MSKYKSERGVHLKRELFYEWNNPDAEYSMRDTGEEPVYVARSGKEYKSLPYIYRNSISEYQCALEVLGSYEHWKKLCACDWFQTGKIERGQYSGVLDWREEKNLAEEAAAKAVIMQAIAEGDLQAAKYLHDKKTKGTAQAKGRPEKKVPVKNKGNVSEIFKQIKSR